MRTTVRIDDDLYRRVKERAAREGRTVASVLEECVRLGIEHLGRRIERPPYALQARGNGTVAPGIDLRDNSAVLDHIDEIATTPPTT